MAGAVVPNSDRNSYSQSNTQLQNDISANNSASIDKDKTPMCLVNELARFNKIKHQYKLTNEQGPPHQKKFTVTLQLGNEEYNADAMSIKKAQHAAAALALSKTNYKQPQTKIKLKASDNITPTVELNALAMKRGEQTVYTVIETPQYLTPPPQPNPLYNGFRPDIYPHSRTSTYNNFNNLINRNGQRCMPYVPNFYSPRFSVPQIPPNGYIKPEVKTVGFYKVKLQIGKHEFMGYGNTNQAARHDAAMKALTQIKNEEKNENIKEVLKSGDSKSVISQVYEVALKMKLPIKFEVLKEDGLPHMKLYITKCTVGSYNVTGEGNGKKLSKRRAAEKMLQTLKEVNESLLEEENISPTLPIPPKNRYKMPRKKNKNLIKETKPNSENLEPNDATYRKEDNNDPVAKLFKIQATKKKKEPIYVLKEDIILSNRKKEFTFEVSVGQFTAFGKGPNKKDAKRNAAEKLLIDMGYESELKRRSIKTNDLPLVSHENKANIDSPRKNGRQIAPGVLLVSPETSTANKPSQGNGGVPLVSVASNVANDFSVIDFQPTKQLDYFSQMLGFKIQYSEFPKGNHNDYLTLVSISTTPPQICHGSGSTSEISRNNAALNAITSLINMNMQINQQTEPTPQGPVNGFSMPQNHYNSNPLTRLS
ncbi:Hypothetical protein CINCED_3A006676 [Cinara cedri]|uniref:DRBM domain-containing protein n=1 Tax=Cinara cedri TaxID=506608 RepID=A0A5E4MCK8_9HEMI|nr:Hypothetical protein CINCED_3A006676 [Cinara cedri]